MASEETELNVFGELLKGAYTTQRNRAFTIANKFLKGATLGYYPDLQEEYRLKDPGYTDKALQLGAEVGGGFLPATKIYGVLKQLARPGFAEAGTGLAEGLGYKAKDIKERLRNAAIGSVGGALPPAVAVGRGVARRGSKKARAATIHEELADLMKRKSSATHEEFVAGNKIRERLGLSPIEEDKATKELIERSEKDWMKYLRDEKGEIPRVVHGGPNVDPWVKPDPNKYLSGTGAMAEGWGFYVSEEDMAAKTYATWRKFSKIGKDIPQEEMIVLNTIDSGKSKIQAQLQKAKQTTAFLNSVNPYGKYDTTIRQYTDEIGIMERSLKNYDDIVKKYEKIPIGRMDKGIGFKGQKEGFDYELLDWDKKITNKNYNLIFDKIDETIERIVDNPISTEEGLNYTQTLEALKDFRKNLEYQSINSPWITGKELYGQMESWFGALYGNEKKFLVQNYTRGGGGGGEATSKFLHSAGIKGTRYPVNSRGKNPSKTKKNIVFYDPSDYTKTHTRKVNVKGDPLEDWKPVAVNLREAIRKIKKGK